MRFKKLLISSLFGVGIVLLPFTCSLTAQEFPTSSFISIQTAAAEEVGEVEVVDWSVQSIWRSVMRQVVGVLDFTAQAIDAVTDAPTQFFDVNGNAPIPGSEGGDGDGTDPFADNNNGVSFVPAPQTYTGTLLVNVPLQVANSFSATGPVTLGGTTIGGNLTVNGAANVGGLSAGASQLGSLSVAGNTTLNTLTVTGPVSFANLTAGVLSVTNSLSVAGNTTLNNVTVADTLTAQGGIDTEGADVDLGEGRVFASNVVNEIIAGDNITISGTPQAPIIEADIPSFGSRVRRLNGLTGTLDLVGGTDVSISESGTDITVSNTSNLATVAARGGCTDCILDVDVVDALTISGGTIDNTVIGSTTAATGTFLTLRVSGGNEQRFYNAADTNYVGFQASSSLSSNQIWTLPTVDGLADQMLFTDGSGNLRFDDVSVLGVVNDLPDLGDVTLTALAADDFLQYDGSEWVNVSSTALGLGDGTFLGLSDTPSSYTATAIPYINAAGTAITYATDFTYDGGLAIGTPTAIDILTVNGDIGILQEQQIHFYDQDDSNYVGFKASTTVDSDVIWTLPDSDGAAGEVLVTDGANNLRFADVSTLGFGDGTYLGLSDTPGSYTANAVTYVNAAGDAMAQSGNFTFSGTQVAIGGVSPVTTLTVAGDVSVRAGNEMRFYNSGNTNYVGFQASSTASGEVWSLPAADGFSDQVLVTDGSGNLRFENVSAVGGGASYFVDLNDTTGPLLDKGIPYVATDTLAFSSEFSFDGDNGRLGVGTDAPSETLTVHGSVYFGYDGSTPGLVYNDSYDSVSIGTTDTTDTSAKLSVQGGSIIQKGGTSTELYAPRSVGSLNLPDTAYAVEVVGSRAYITSRFTGTDFHVVDITDKTNPALLGSLSLPDTARKVSVAGNYAYVVTDVSGDDFQVIDISDPGSPSVIAGLNLGTSANGLFVRGRYAYVGTGNAAGVDFFVIDIIDPLNPEIVGSIDVDADINDVKVSDNNAFIITDSPASFISISVSDPAAPTIVASSSLAADGSAIALPGGGDYAYVITSTGVGDDFYVFDISDPTSLSNTASIDLVTGANGVYVSGKYAYVSTSGTGDDFHVIDIENVSNPVEVGSVEMSTGSAWGVQVRGRYAYITSDSTGSEFHVYDVTGVEAQSVLAHTLESGSLSVVGDIVAAGYQTLAGGLRVGNDGIETDGNLLIYGSGQSYFGGSVSIGTTTTDYELAVQGDVLVTGQFYDSAYNPGAYGELLMSNGVGQVWTSTSSLGLSGEFTTSADLAAILSDETGSGSVVFSASPTFTGAVQVSALSVSSTLSLLGTNANIALGSNYISGDGDDEGIFIDSSNGYVGIGTTTPASALTVAGTIQASNLYGTSTTLSTDANGNIIRTPSDARLKRDVLDIQSPLEKVLALRGVTYHWIDTRRFGEQAEIGFLAQEVDLVVPEAVRKGGEYWSLNTPNLVAVVVEAIKEMWLVVSGNQEKVTELEDRVKYLESLLDVEAPEETEGTEVNNTESGEVSGRGASDAVSEEDPETDDVNSEEEQNSSPQDGDVVTETDGVSDSTGTEEEASEELDVSDTEEPIDFETESGESDEVIGEQVDQESVSEEVTSSADEIDTESAAGEEQVASEAFDQEPDETIEEVGSSDSGSTETNSTNEIDSTQTNDSVAE